MVDIVFHQQLLNLNNFICLVYMEKKIYVVLRVAFVITPVLPSKRYQDYNFRSKNKLRKILGVNF